MADDTRAAVKAPAKAVRFAVEFGDKLNRNFIFNFGNKPVRGRWEKRNYLPNTTVNDEFAGMPDIPGIVLEMDSARKMVKWTDPLGDPRNAEALRQAQAVYKRCFKDDIGPERDAVVDNLTDDDIKSYCYWTRRMLDNGSLKVHRGAVPEMDEIRAMPGKVSFANADQGANVERMRDIPRRYAKPPVDALPRAAQGAESVIDSDFGEAE